jgi:hypothetical protein
MKFCQRGNENNRNLESFEANGAGRQTTEKEESGC